MTISNIELDFNGIQDNISPDYVTMDCIAEEYHCCIIIDGVGTRLTHIDSEDGISWSMDEHNLNFNLCRTAIEIYNRINK